MFTLDSTRKATERKRLIFSQDGFRPMFNNGAGVFIVLESSTNKYWMSVPVSKKGTVRLYPIMEIEQDVG